MLGYIQDRIIYSKGLEVVKILGSTYVFHKPSLVCGHDSTGISQFGNKFSINQQCNLWPYEVSLETRRYG